MWPIIIRIISGRCVSVGSKVTAVEAIAAIARNLPRFTSIAVSSQGQGQIARIIRVMAEIKAKNVQMLPFDLAKNALANEKGLITMFGNNFLDCAEFFAALWEALIKAKVIVIG